jgi:hypothetical protein
VVDQWNIQGRDCVVEDIDQGIQGGRPTPAPTLLTPPSPAGSGPVSTPSQPVWWRVGTMGGRGSTGRRDAITGGEKTQMTIKTILVKCV